MGAGSVKGIEIHDRREKDGISHTNKDIDWKRTKFNYDLHPSQSENFYRVIKQRISELDLKKAVRKDAVVMVQVLVTSEYDFFKNMDPEKQEQFFKDSYEFLKDRYGERNIISATVHLDERTPHMHFNFVPVTEDGRLSAKSILTRQSLIKQQDDFQKCVGEKYGLQRGMTKEERIEKGVQRKNFTVPEYKALMTEIQRKEKELEELKEKASNALQSVSKTRDEVSTIKDALIPLQAEYEAKKAYVESCNKESNISMLIPEYAKVKKSLLGNETVTVPLEKWEKRHISANEKKYLEDARKELEKSIIDFRKTASADYITKLENAIKSMNYELVNTKKDNEKLMIKLNKSENEIDKIFEKVNKVLKKFPDEIAERFVQAWKSEIQKSHDMER
jgi:predicted  nucleic acid-binding Zn-ribbon protein